MMNYHMVVLDTRGHSLDVDTCVAESPERAFEAQMKKFTSSLEDFEVRQVARTPERSQFIVFGGNGFVIWFVDVTRDLGVESN